MAAALSKLFSIVDQQEFSHRSWIYAQFINYTYLSDHLNFSNMY